MRIHRNVRNTRHAAGSGVFTGTGDKPKFARFFVTRPTRKKLLFFCVLFLSASTSLSAQSKREYVFENGRLTEVKENDNTCTLSPTNNNIAGTSGTYSFNVLCSGNQSWTAMSNQSWISVVTGSGSGSGQVSYTVTSNSGTLRSGTITVAGKIYTVSQQQNRAVCIQNCDNAAAVCEPYSMCLNNCVTGIMPKYPECHPAINSCMAMFFACGTDSACKTNVIGICGTTDACLNTIMV